MANEELKACPFCGGSAGFIDDYEGISRLHYYIYCPDCRGCGPSERAFTKRAAIRKWNHRSEDAKE